MRLHELLETRAPLSRLDWALAQLLHHQQPSDDVRHRWLAALTSHQWSRGHACLDLLALQHNPGALLGWTQEQLAHLPHDLTQACASLPWCEGSNSPLVKVQHPHGQRLYLRRAWQAEHTIRTHLHERMQHTWPLPADLPRRLDALFGPASAQAGNPADPQRVACEVAARHAISLITGGPGTGKTTTVVRLLALLLDLHGPAPLRIHLAAPTGKAAARLVQSISAALAHMPAEVRARIPVEAQTLHRLLRRVEGTQTLASDVVVIDEASMIDLEMMARLLRSVPTQARLVLLGDRDQLASVQAGAVMAQLCELPALAPHIVTLTHSHRFQAERGIGQWAQTVNRDSAPTELPALWRDTPPVPMRPDASWPDITRMQEGTDSELATLVHHGWHDWQQQLSRVQASHACTHAQALELLHALGQLGVLCATREGPHGVLRLTQRIERCLHLPSPDALGWYVGRPVMVTRNDYALGLMNGDIGLCLPHAEGGLRVAFADQTGGVRWLQTARLGAVETVWAMTVHKSQGSEFAHVLLVLPSDSSPVLTRELVYTGMTRARQRLTLWAAQPHVLFAACAQRVMRSGGLTDPAS